MSNRSIHLRPKLDRLDEIPTTLTNEKRDRRSFAETETSPEKLDVPTRKTQSFGAGNTRTPHVSRISVSTIHENKVFEDQKSGVMESGGFERNASAQNSANHNPYRKTSKMGRPLSTGMGAINPGFTTSRGSSIYGGSLGSLPLVAPLVIITNQKLHVYDGSWLRLKTDDL